jgi:hypothetical protein
MTMGTVLPMVTMDIMQVLTTVGKAKCDENDLQCVHFYDEGCGGSMSY